MTILLGATPRPYWLTTHPFPEVFPGLSAGPVSRTKGHAVIGSDVGLGWGALVLFRSDDGHGAVMAAGALVTWPVPPHALVAGNPARVIKERFDDETIAVLREIK